MNLSFCRCNKHRAIAPAWALFILLSYPVSAQQKIISGTIRDKNTNEPIPFAAVQFMGTTEGATTNEKGAYLFKLNNFPGDTLIVHVIGYTVRKLPINQSLSSQTINFILTRGAYSLREFVIHGGINPALILLHKIILHKPQNDNERLNSYKYTAYNKLEVDLDKINKNKLIHSGLFKPFAFIFHNIDSTSEGIPYLPVFLTETISDFYFQSHPVKKKELIIASHSSGLKHAGLQQFLGSMYQRIDIYHNFIPVFGKSFVSPISNFGTLYYNYKITDTQYIDSRKCFQVAFEPKRKGEQTFFGDFWVNDTTFAIQNMSMQVSNSANINFVTKVSLVEEYTPLNDKQWFLTKSKLIANFDITSKKAMGFIGRKETRFTGIKVNDASATDIFNKPQYAQKNIFILPGAEDKNDSFWLSHRTLELNKDQKAIYTMMDTLQKMPLFHEYSNIARFIATGKKAFGPIAVGPYYYLFNFNSLEKFRVRMGLSTTEKFSKNIYLNGYLAYGFGDKKFKGGIAGLWLLQKSPRISLYGSYTHDLDNGAIHYHGDIGVDNIFSIAIRRPHTTQKFVMVDEKKLSFYKEWINGFSQEISLINTQFAPYAPLPVGKYYAQSSLYPLHPLNDMQINFRVRFAYREKFLNRNSFYRLSLGSRYPMASLDYALGIKGLLHGSYHYQKIRIGISNKLNIPPFGKLHYQFYAGKIFGTLPFPLLKILPGNELYYYNKHAFNLMNRYEFIGDEYAGFNIEHDLGSGIFSYIPVVRNWKLRQFWTAKGIMGNLSQANKNLNLYNGYPFRTLGGRAYIEIGTGVENIFHLIRIDFIWRVTPMTFPNGYSDNGFGVFGSMRLRF